MCKMYMTIRNYRTKMLRFNCISSRQTCGYEPVMRSTKLYVRWVAGLFIVGRTTLPHSSHSSPKRRRSLAIRSPLAYCWATLPSYRSRLASVSILRPVSGSMSGP